MWITEIRQFEHDPLLPNVVTGFAKGEVTEMLRGELAGPVKLRFAICIDVYPVQVGRDYLILGLENGAGKVQPLRDGTVSS